MTTQVEEANNSYGSRMEGLTSEKVWLDASRFVISNGVIPLMVGAGEAILLQPLIASGISPENLCLTMVGVSLANFVLFVGTEWLTGGMEESVSTPRVVARTGISMVVPVALGISQIAFPESRPFFNAAHEATMHNGGKVLEWMGHGAKRNWDNFWEWWNRPSESATTSNTPDVKIEPQSTMDSTKTIVNSGTGISGEVSMKTPDHEWWTTTPIGTAYVIGTMLGIPTLGAILAYKAHGFVKNLRGE